MAALGEISKIKKDLINGQKQFINLLIGDPDHEPPEQLLDALEKNVRHAYGYTDQQGDLNTRAVIAQYLQKEGIIVGAENLFLSSGSKIIGKGLIETYADKHVLLQIPYYPPYVKQIVKTPAGVDLSSTIADMENKIRNDKIDIAIIVSPNNPSGHVVNNDMLLQLYDCCNKNGTKLVIDEAYSDFCYEGKFESIASKVDIKDTDNLIILRTFSKSLGFCGLRLGYSISSKKVATDLTIFQSDSVNPPNNIAQYGVRDSLLEINPMYFVDNSNRYKSRLERMVENFNSRSIEVSMPDGAFYLFMDVKKDSREFCPELAKETGVLTWPGSDYGKNNFIRISLADVSNEDVDIASAQITKYIKK